MVVDEAHRLHESVASGRTHEGPAALFEVLAESGGFVGFGEFAGPGECEGGFSRGGFELEEVGVQGVEFCEEIEGTVGVVDGGEDFPAMADDAGVENEAFDVGVIEVGNLIEIKIGKGSAEIFAFAEDGEPGEPGLKSFEADFFEEAEVIGDSPTPLIVVVTKVIFIIAAPPATDFSIGAGDETVFGRGHEKESFRSRERY